MKPQKKEFAVPVRAARALSAYLAALVIILSISAGSAWSFESHDLTTGAPASLNVDDGAMPLVTTSPSPTVADSCLPLLKSIRHISPNSATDWNQRSAGKAAALGLVFGVRFALGPVEKPNSTNRTKARFDVWQPEGSYAGNRHALAVSAYRQCQKEKALNALGDFRWAR